MTTNKANNIDEYIAGFPQDIQKALKQMRACLRKAAPEAEESIKWGVPAFSYHRILFQFAAFKHYISFYPTPSVVKAFAKDLSDYKTSSSTIQFPLDKPLPLPLIRKIAVFRVRESIEKDVKWM
ncbi:MAG: hypothetical protein APF76_08435 [Desulfitibacter sp. BRH_c19]|nr:MAG: hypothetical protein APF76_08435 [Desulfitibacter sp. BRH_c19]